MGKIKIYLSFEQLEENYHMNNIDLENVINSWIFIIMSNHKLLSLDQDLEIPDLRRGRWVIWMKELMTLTWKLGERYCHLDGGEVFYAAKP